MPAPKIQNETEVRRWFEEGHTYRWMANEYMRKYHLEVSPSLFSNLRRRRGWDRRINRDDDLIPWEIKREHRWAFAVRLLRFEARRRNGMKLSAKDEQVLTTWKQNLRSRGEVVHYDPGSLKGFHYVKRTLGDRDIIREPEQKTTRRLAADR